MQQLGNKTVIRHTFDNMIEEQITVEIIANMQSLGSTDLSFLH